MIMEKLRKEYLDTCDRIYLNEQVINKLRERSIHNGSAVKKIVEQIRKDTEIKKALEEKLGM